jgi:hypothetical protein
MRFLSLLLLLAACNYHLLNEDIADGGELIEVPYVRGDIGGLLTDHLVREVARSGLFTYAHGSGKLSLQVEILSDESMEIGYQYDRKDATGCRDKNILPSETRRIIVAKVTLIDTLSGQPLIAPYEIQAYSEYDYANPSSINELAFIDSCCTCRSSLKFSLGQFDSIDSAEDNALSPLFRRLAHEIMISLSKRYVENSRSQAAYFPSNAS